MPDMSIPKQIKMDAGTERHLIAIAEQDGQSQSATVRNLINKEWLARVKAGVLEQRISVEPGGDALPRP
jgi:hypothetical protein